MLLLLALLLGASPASAKFTEVKIPPVDEATRVPSFYEFRDRLKGIVKAKNVEQLLSHVDEKIQFNFGAGGEGRRNFEKEWKLGSNAKASKLWRELAKVLVAGAIYHNDKNFTVPYYVDKWPGELDPFEFNLVVGERVDVRKAPEADAPRVKEVSYLVVKPKGKAKKGWQEVELPSGETGFVPELKLRSSIGYRAEFHFKKDRWMMTSFVAGD